MRPVSRLALAAALAAAVLTVATVAAAKPKPPHGHGHGAPVPGAGLSHVGYRIVGEPLVEEAPGHLVTRAIRWQLRSVWADARGREILVRPLVEGPGSKAARDSEVRVDRPWRPGDQPRTSVLFRHFDRALERYRQLRKSADLDALPLDAPEGGPVVVVPPPTPPPPRPPPVKTCESVLIDLGHSPTHLSRCNGVQPRCAVTLLERGHHPTHLDHCRAVEPDCAQHLLDKGHHPTHLDKCTVDLAPRCAATLLDKGHHPTHLDKCRGVRDACAVMLLDKGHHPTHLSQCR